MSAAIHKLLKAVFAVVDSWCRCDQVRVSPAAGRLLKLQIGDTFLLFDTVYSVIDKTVLDDDRPVRIIYQLSDGNVQRTLTVAIISATHERTVARLSTNETQSIDIFADDIAMLPPRL